MVGQRGEGAEGAGSEVEGEEVTAADLFVNCVALVCVWVCMASAKMGGGTGQVGGVGVLTLRPNDHEKHHVRGKMAQLLVAECVEHIAERDRIARAEREVAIQRRPGGWDTPEHEDGDIGE